jgi:hypothetical protein
MSDTMHHGVIFAAQLASNDTVNETIYTTLIGAACRLSENSRHPVTVPRLT